MEVMRWLSAHNRMYQRCVGDVVGRIKHDRVVSDAPSSETHTCKRQGMHLAPSGGGRAAACSDKRGKRIAIRRGPAALHALKKCVGIVACLLPMVEKSIILAHVNHQVAC